ncbi:MAG: hypothetical protein ACI4RA_00890 [Kiritimatiellia bacterium]
MGTFNDFAQLKGFKPAPLQPTPAPPPSRPEERTLADAADPSDYFSSLLGNGKPQTARAQPKVRQTTVATPATMARIREEQAAAARAAEREAFAAREAQLREELEAQTAASESLATDLAALRQEFEALRRDLEACRVDCDVLEGEKARLEGELAAARNAPPQTVPDVAALAQKDQEIERLQALLVEAQRDVRLHGALLDMPEPFSERFPGEVREHIIETLAAANEAAEAGGRDRRARILEAVLGANPASGELDQRRGRVRQIIKNAGFTLDHAALAELEKLGFRLVSGNKHYKLEWAGIRFPLAKTPSDHRACLNSAVEICNRVF